MTRDRHCLRAVRRFARIVFAALLFGSAHAIAEPVNAGDKPSDTDPKALRVMTFNIRNSAARDGANAWSHRQALVIGTMREFNPDLFGAQEVLADQFEALRDTFQDYTAVGVARDDGARKGEWALILFRKARFEQIDAGNFWLSERPDEIGSKSWDAALTRICSWVKLRDRTAQRQLVFANTHFDHKGVIARRESARALRERLAALAGADPLVLTGDFNCTDTDDPYRVLVGENGAGTNSLALYDSYREIHSERQPDEGTFHAFKGGATGARIDWILHSKDFRAVAASIVRPAAGPFASDHYPVTAVLTYRAP